MPQLDEVLGRVTNPEDKAFLEKIFKDQNSYITKLETQLKSSQTSQQEPKQNMDGITKAYLEQKMKEDIIGKAEASVRQSVNPDMVNAVREDWLLFLDKNMDIQHTTLEYAVDAFNLVLGRCLAKKDHAVNQIGKGTTPNPTPNNPQQAGTNAQGVQEVNNILRQTPPTMTPGDANAVSGIPNPQPNQVKNTRDAFANLKSKLSGGKNPFQ